MGSLQHSAYLNKVTKYVIIYAYRNVVPTPGGTMVDFIRRCWLLFTIFMTGNVPSISAAQVALMRIEWNRIAPDARPKAYEELQSSTRLHRMTIGEIASRGSFMLTTLGFAFGIVVTILPDAKGISLLITKISIAFFFAATVLVLWMLSPKLKFYTRNRDEKPEASRKLSVLPDALASDDAKKDAEFDKYLRLANQRETQDRVASVEQRALLTATLFFILGLVIDAVVIATHH